MASGIGGLMTELLVGVGEISLRIRHARSLKDKRQVTRGLIEKLRKQGFSVVEHGDVESLKQSRIAYAYIGSSAAGVKKMLAEPERLLLGGFEVVNHYQSILDYQPEQSWVEDEMLSIKEGEPDDDIE